MTINIYITYYCTECW